MVKRFNADVIAVGQLLKAANSCFPTPELQADGVISQCRSCSAADACFVFFPGCQRNTNGCMERWAEALEPVVTKLGLHASYWVVLKWEYLKSGCVGHNEEVSSDQTLNLAPPTNKTVEF